jgi:hypothetical protein
VASAADHLEDELATLQRQRDRYAMAAEAATDPKVSLGHLRNVERLDEEIEALRSALEAMPSKADRRSAEQAVTLGFDWGEEGEEDDEQTRVFDASTMPVPEPEPQRAAPLAKPVIASGVAAPVHPSVQREPLASPSQPHPAEMSTPFGRVPAPFSSQDLPPSGPIDLDLPQSGMKKASIVVLVLVAISAVLAGLWYALEPPAKPAPRDTSSTPTVIEAAPVPTDAQHR